MDILTGLIAFIGPSRLHVAHGSKKCIELFGITLNGLKFADNCFSKRIMEGLILPKYYHYLLLE
jgi:hypothetical protein